MATAESARQGALQQGGLKGPNGPTGPVPAAASVPRMGATGCHCDGEQRRTTLAAPCPLSDALERVLCWGPGDRRGDLGGAGHWGGGRAQTEGPGPYHRHSVLIFMHLS